MNKEQEAAIEQLDAKLGAQRKKHLLCTIERLTAKRLEEGLEAVANEAAQAMLRHGHRVGLDRSRDDENNALLFAAFDALGCMAITAAFQGKLSKADIMVHLQLVADLSELAIESGAVDAPSGEATQCPAVDSADPDALKLIEALIAIVPPGVNVDKIMLDKKHQLMEEMGVESECDEPRCILHGSIKAEILAGHRPSGDIIRLTDITKNLGDHFGEVCIVDMGKRVFVTSLGDFTMENTEQRDAREKKEKTQAQA